jgi:hypothetical protein
MVRILTLRYSKRACIAVKSRIKSVQNIKKITSAMKMVAASKMRRAQTAQEQAKAMPIAFLKLFGEETSTHLHDHRDTIVSIHNVLPCELPCDIQIYLCARL